jgi:threonyl-tRNA synthetase
MPQHALETMRHSAAHLLAAAVLELYPDAKLGVGPVIEHGFFYDFLLPQTLSEHDLPKIEKRMREIKKRNVAFKREEMGVDNAITLFKEEGQQFKGSLLQDLKTRGTTAIREEESQDLDPKKASKVSVYWTGKFVDLCRGPHVVSTREIGKFKLTKVAGAYWRGDENNEQLTRIYGVAFSEESELAAHLTMLAEAERRDHRKLGAQLNLFTFSPLVGAGLPLFTGRGNLMRKLIEEAVLDLQAGLGYEQVWIPHIAKSDLYKTSGHWDKFEDDLFHVSSKKTDTEFVLKPMNCPHHTQLYAAKPRSYRDLPIGTAEVTTIYRDENTGQLQGLTRVRSITQDDLHVFCRLDQVEAEIKKIYQVVKKFYKIFGMPLRAYLSTHDPKNKKAYLGDEKLWKQSEEVLTKLLKQFKEPFEIGAGDAAFYGPKIDFIAKDAIGREWQLATIQLDFNQPERFGLVYTDKDGKDKQPVMIHRAVLGSVERFMGVLIEHYAGAFPVWLSPVQVAVVPVGIAHSKVGELVGKVLREAGMRVEIDTANETVGKKIRRAESGKVPYMLVIGDKEAKGLTAATFARKKFAVRIRGKKEMLTISGKQFLERVLKEIEKKK